MSVALYVPANLMKLLQAFDVFFNALFKTKLSETHNKRIVQAFMDFRDSKKTRETEALASGDEFVKEAYKVKTKLSETKESFYSDLAQVLQIFQTDEFKEKIKTES